MQAWSHYHFLLKHSLIEWKHKNKKTKISSARGHFTVIVVLIQECSSSNAPLRPTNAAGPCLQPQKSFLKKVESSVHSRSLEHTVCRKKVFALSSYLGTLDATRARSCSIINSLNTYLSRLLTALFCSIRKLPCIKQGWRLNNPLILIIRVA